MVRDVVKVSQQMLRHFYSLFVRFGKHYVLKGQSFKLYNNKYMMASTQITITEISH